MPALLDYDYIIIDCHNLAYRSWWHVRSLKTSTGTPSGMEYGFLSGFLRLVGRHPRSRWVLAWDGVPERCLSLFPVVQRPDGTRIGYKAHREILTDKKNEPDWGPRLARLRESLAPLVSTLYSPTTEADEEIARLVLMKMMLPFRCLIYSRDRDMKQLTCDRIHLCMFDKDPETGDPIFLTGGSIQAEHGFPSWKLPLYRAIEGDGSDGIPGIPRIPRVLITELVSASDSLDTLIDVIRRGDSLKTASQRAKLQGSDAEALIRRNYEMMNLYRQGETLPNFFGKPLRDVRPVLALCDELELKALRSRVEWGRLTAPPGS